MTLTTWQPDDELTSARLNAMVSAYNGIESLFTTGLFDRALTVREDAVSTYVLTVQHQTSGATGNKLLLVETDTGATAFEVASLGGAGGSAATVTAYAPALVVGNVRNWTSNSDLFVSHNRVTGSPTGSFVPVFVGMDTCTQPTDGFNGSAGIPDEVGISTVVRARNAASGGSQNYDGSLRAQEAQTLVFASTGLTRTYGSLEVGIHTALDQDSVIEDPVSPDNRYGSYGVAVHSTTQSDTGFGTPQRANFGFMTFGDKGFKHPFCAFDTDGITPLWRVTQTGEQRASHIMPRTGSTYTIGSATAADFWSAMYANFHVVTANGTAAGPVVTRSDDTDTGLAWATDALLLSAGGVESARALPTTLQITLGERLSGVISPTALTTNTDDYAPTGLGSARIVRISATGAVNLTGIAAQTAGTVITLINTAAGVITLKHEVTSTAANRFNLPNGADIALQVHGAVELWYDGATTRWKKLSG